MAAGHALGRLPHQSVILECVLERSSSYRRDVLAGLVKPLKTLWEKRKSTSSPRCLKCNRRVPSKQTLLAVRLIVHLIVLELRMLRIF